MDVYNKLVDTPVTHCYMLDTSRIKQDSDG